MARRLPEEVFYTRIAEEWEALEAIEELFRSVAESTGNDYVVLMADNFGRVSGTSLADARQLLRGRVVRVSMAVEARCSLEVWTDLENTLTVEKLPEEEARRVVEGMHAIVDPIEARQEAERQHDEQRRVEREAAAAQLHRRVGGWIRSHANDLAVNAIVGVLFFGLGLFVAC